MDINRAKEIVTTLAEGIDPLTGEVLPKDHICNQADVVRAFYALLKVAEKVKQKTQPENAGRPWSEEDDEALKLMHRDGASVTEISKHFKRTRFAIETRLNKLGLE